MTTVRVTLNHICFTHLLIHLKKDVVHFIELALVLNGQNCKTDSSDKVNLCALNGKQKDAVISDNKGF